uniref:DUF223 domain-containing protein n=1 Tax=Oryza punctata TaxID=4537 RepID=A0A0E0JYY2_ORYPU
MGSPTRLKDITLGQQNCKVLGRLIRLWDAQNITSNTLISIDGITIPRKFKNKFWPLLTLSSVYMFVDINVVDIRNKKYIYHHQKYMLQFKGSTKYASDRHVGPYDYAGKTSSKKNRNLKIRNKDEQEQEIVLWGEYGETFDKASILPKSTNHEIVVSIFVGLTAGSYLEISEYHKRNYGHSGTFNNVAEDLVTINATQSSQNMKIDATVHAMALDTDIGKRRLFHIAMNTKYYSHFSINYVLKKSHPVENEKETLMLPASSNHEVSQLY